MKIITLFVLLLVSLFCDGQPGNLLATTKYAGVYSYGDNLQKGPSGWVTIFPETDSTVLFYLDISHGPPSFNLGKLYDRLQFKNGEGLYVSNMVKSSPHCKWLVTIDENELKIRTLDNCYDCGFGNAVSADNRYVLSDKRTPEFFMDGHGRKIYFKTTSPEKYLK